MFFMIKVQATTAAVFVFTVNSTDFYIYFYFLTVTLQSFWVQSVETLRFKSFPSATALIFALPLCCLSQVSLGFLNTCILLSGFTLTWISMEVGSSVRGAGLYWLFPPASPGDVPLFLYRDVWHMHMEKGHCPDMKMHSQPILLL